MKMTRAEPTISISDENLIMIVVVIVTVIIIVFILVMIRDYRLYLGNHWKKKFSFADFVKQEQFYIYTVVLPSFGRFGIVVTKRVFILKQ